MPDRVTFRTAFAGRRAWCDSEPMRPKRTLPVVALALLGAAAPLAGAASPGGIRGRVTSSPTCPVERVPPDPACAPKGFAATVRIFRLTDQQTVRRLRTGADGRFTVQLRPGRYGVVARPTAGGPLPRCGGSVTAVVHSGKQTRVALGCDSGIR